MFHIKQQYLEVTAALRCLTKFTLLYWIFFFFFFTFWDFKKISSQEKLFWIFLIPEEKTQKVKTDVCRSLHECIDREFFSLLLYYFSLLYYITLLHQTYEDAVNFFQMKISLVLQLSLIICEKITTNNFFLIIYGTYNISMLP